MTARPHVTTSCNDYVQTVSVLYHEVLWAIGLRLPRSPPIPESMRLHTGTVSPQPFPPLVAQGIIVANRKFT